MANAYTNKAVISSRAVEVLRREVIVYPLFRDPQTEADFQLDSFGGRITYRIPARTPGRMKGSPDTVITDYAEDEVTLTYTEDDLAYVASGFNAVEQTFETNQRERVVRIVQSQSLGVSEAVSLHLYKAVQEVPTFVLTGGTLAAPTTPSEVAEVDAVNTKLNDQLAGTTEPRWMILDSQGHADILGIDEFKNANVSGDPTAMTTGSMQGMVKRGFAFWWTQAVSSSNGFVPAVGRHVVGTFADVAVVAAPLVDGVAAVGSTTVTIDGGVGTETLKKGDLFQTTTVTDADGNFLQFVVLADAVAASGEITVSVSPAVSVELPNDEPLTFVGNHRKYLAGRNGCILSSVVPPVSLRGVISEVLDQSLFAPNVAAFIHPESGMGMAIESFAKEARSLKSELQTSTFAKSVLVRPEFCTVVLGTY